MEEREEYRCLAALIAAAISYFQEKSQESTFLPSLSDLERISPREAIRTFLSKLKEQNKRKVFLLVDEFEELLGRNEEIRAKIISGIKGIIDREAGMICKGGEFEGYVHLLIACTRDAWLEIIKLPEIGGLISRGIPRIIDLERLSAYEVFHLILSQLKHDYGGKEVEKTPFEPGVIYAIHKSSLGNPRAVIQLYIKLMKRAMEDCPAGLMKIINGDVAIEVLSTSRVYVEDEEIVCLRSDVLKDLEKEVMEKYGEKSYITVLRILIGEPKPFSVNELKERLCRYSEQKIKTILNRLKGTLLLSIGRAKVVTGYRKLLGGRAALRNAISDLIIRDKIVYGEEELDFDDFAETFTYYDFNGLKIIERGLYIPDRKEELIDLLNVSDEMGTELFERLMAEAKFEDTKYYKLSVAAANQLYPLTIWGELRFIKNAKDRRDINRRIRDIWPTKMGEQLFLESVLHVLKLRGVYHGI